MLERDRKDDVAELLERIYQQMTQDIFQYTTEQSERKAGQKLKSGSITDLNTLLGARMPNMSLYRL